MSIKQCIFVLAKGNFHTVPNTPLMKFQVLTTPEGLCRNIGGLLEVKKGEDIKNGTAIHHCTNRRKISMRILRYLLAVADHDTQASLKLFG